MPTISGEIRYIADLTLMRIQQEVKSYTLGLVWWYLDPIINTLLLYIVTVLVMGLKTPDATLFLLSGLLIFRFLQSAISVSCNSLKPAFTLSSRIYVAKYPFVIRDVAAEALKLIVGIVFLALLTVYLGNSHFNLPETVFVVFVSIVFALAISSFCAIGAAIVYDVRLIVGYVFRILFFVSGLFFSIESIPEKWKSLFLLNPFALLVHEFRLATCQPDAINLAPLCGLLVVSLAVAALGFTALVYFDRKLPKYVI